jgi:hypothetical protein
VGRLKVLTFAWARMEQLYPAGTDALGLGGIVHREPSPLVQTPRVFEHVLTPPSIHMEAYDLMANRALRCKRMKASSAE